MTDSPECDKYDPEVVTLTYYMAAMLAHVVHRGMENKTPNVPACMQALIVSEVCYYEYLHLLNINFVS